MISRTSPLILNVVLSVAVFCSFFGIYFLLNSTTPNLPAYDDGYYHIARAYSYWTGHPLAYPTVSTLARLPVNIYFGFHALLAPFTSVFTGTNYDELIFSVKLFSNILAGLYFVGIFLLGYFFGRHLGLSERRARIFGLLTCVVLFVLFADFDFRLIMLRPHVISSLIVFFILIATAVNRPAPIFLASALFPFFYSFSVLGLLPLFCFIIARYLWNGFRLRKKDFIPLGAGIAGLLVGILLRPDSFAYVFNAIGVHTLVLLNRFTGESIPGASELGTASIYIGSLPWLLPFLLVSLFVLSRMITEKSIKIIPFSYFYVAFTSFCFFLLYLVVNRTMEYFAALGALSIAGFFVTPMPMLALKKGIWGTAASLPEKFKEWFPKRTLISVFTVVLAVLFFVNIFRIVKWNDGLAPYNVYRGAAEFMKQDSRGQGTVFTQGYDVYSRLVFFDSDNSYIMGMDHLFAYIYNKDLYWLWVHIMRSENVCPKEHCQAFASRDVFDIIKTDFKSKYIFLDSSLSVAVTTPEGTRAFQARLESDKRFKKVFQDANYPAIFVYRLEEGVPKAP